MYSYLPIQEKCFPTLYMLQAPLVSLSSVSKPIPDTAKPKSLETTHDLTINHKLKYFVRKEPVSHFYLHRKLLCRDRCSYIKSLRLTFQLAQNRSQWFSNKILICFPVISRGAAWGHFVIGKLKHRTHAQGHTRL